MLALAELVPEEIMMHHIFHDKIYNERPLMCVSKGTCDLKITGELANQQLRQHLEPCGCTPSKLTPASRNTTPLKLW